MENNSEENNLNSIENEYESGNNKHKIDCKIDIKQESMEDPFEETNLIPAENFCDTLKEEET